MRGDLGESKFSSRKMQLTLSSPISLADFIDHLSKEAKTAQIVIIAHSLGAQVTLEALKELCESKDNDVHVNNLIIVQGAVACNISI